MKPIIASLKENNSKGNKHLDKLEKGICTCEMEVKEEPLGNSLNFAHFILKLDLLTTRQKKTPFSPLPTSHPNFFLPFLLFLNFLFSPLLVSS